MKRVLRFLNIDLTHGMRLFSSFFHLSGLQKAGLSPFCYSSETIPLLQFGLRFLFRVFFEVGRFFRFVIFEFSCLMERINLASVFDRGSFIFFSYEFDKFELSVSSFTKRKFKINEKLRGLISICRSQEIIFSANKNNHSKQTFLENDGDSSCD